MLLAVSSAAAQDLGEAARQERERKSNLTRHVPVLTNEDLARDRIIAPPTEAPAVATAPAPAATVVNKTPATPVAVQTITPGPDQPGFSLGEYARKVRQEKAERLAAHERQANPPAPAAPTAVVVTASSQPAETRTAAPPAQLLHRTKPVTKDVFERRTVQVRRGDSLWRISRLHLGRGHLWPLVWKSNPQIAKPEIIQIGQTLRLPSPEVVAAALAKEDATRVARAGPARGQKVSTPASRATVPTVISTGNSNPPWFGTGFGRRNQAAADQGTGNAVDFRAMQPARSPGMDGDLRSGAIRAALPAAAVSSGRKPSPPNRDPR